MVIYNESWSFDFPATLSRFAARVSQTLRVGIGESSDEKTVLITVLPRYWSRYGAVFSKASAGTSRPRCARQRKQKRAQPAARRDLYCAFDVNRADSIRQDCRRRLARVRQARCGSSTTPAALNGLFEAYTQEQITPFETNVRPYGGSAARCPRTSARIGRETLVTLRRWEVG